MDASLIDQFIGFGRSKGIEIPRDLKVGDITRFRVNGSKKKNGFAFFTLNPDGTAGGTIGDWADRSRDIKWHSGKNGSSFNGYDWKEHEAMFEKAREEERRIRAEMQETVAVDLRAEYDKGISAFPSFPYLQAKRIRPHGIKQRRNALLIPMKDRAGQLTSIQRILADGKKLFAKGGRVEGCRYNIGDLQPEGAVYVGEGFATMATVHEVTGIPCVVCFTANNLKPVLKDLTEDYPDMDITVTADNDIKTMEKRGFNPGVEKATSACRELKLKMVICPVNSDFNDLFCQQGADAVVKALSDFEGGSIDDCLKWLDAEDDKVVISKQWAKRAIFLDKTEREIFINAVKDKTKIKKSTLQGELKSTTKKRINSSNWKKSLPFCFWDITPNENGDLKLFISNELLYQFFEKSGFHNTDELFGSKRLVSVVGNVCQEVTIDDLRNFLTNDAMAMLPDEVAPGVSRFQLQAELREKISMYVSEPKVETLSRIQIEPHRDTKDEIFFYFKNGIVRVTAEDVVLISYAYINTVIWKGGILPHEITIGDGGGPFEQFCQNVCRIENIINDTEVVRNIDRDRYAALKTVIGYLLSRYVDPAYTRAVSLTDNNLSERPEGGTGKTQIARAISHLRNQAFCDGKTMKADTQFAFQNLSIGTQSLLIDDVPHNFNLETFFSKITTSHEYEQKYKPKIQFSEADNPKTIITTNYAIRGEGNSYDRRRYEFEVTRFYNGTHTPLDDVGTLFHWESRDKWNLFFNFMFECCQDFLRNGGRMKPYYSATLEQKKMVTSLGWSFHQFVEDLDINVTHDYNQRYEEYKDTLSESMGKRLTKKQFTSKLKQYCKVKSLSYEYDNHNKTFIIETPF